MLLEDATSKEQVARALDDDDEELRQDIEDKLRDASRWWSNEGFRDYVTSDEQTSGFRDIALDEHFIDEVIAESPSRYDLSNVDREEVESNLKWAATHPRRERGGERYGPFRVQDHGSSGFTFEVETQEHAHFPADELPHNAEFIPSDLALSFWSDLDGGVEWDQVDRVEENFGWRRGESYYIAADEEAFSEWCRDTISSYVDGVIKRSPDAAIELFWKGLAAQSPTLAERFKAAEPPRDELLDFAAQFYEQDGSAEVIETIKDYFKALDTDVDEPREVIGEWTQADLRAMGITKGPLYEEAPWKLIKLHPADLRLEGALMRHCVGDANMGYIKALSDGDVELWSLRSRANKPRFTLEVDGSFHTHREDGDRRWAAKSIKQVKGKANRTPGFADKQATVIKFPDEVRFWATVFSKQLGVAPEDVEDFDAVRGPVMEPNHGDACVGFDMPYQPLQ